MGFLGSMVRSVPDLYRFMAEASPVVAPEDNAVTDFSSLKQARNPGEPDGVSPRIPLMKNPRAYAQWLASSRAFFSIF